MSFAATPVLAVLSFRYRRQLRTAARPQRSHEGVIASTAGEALSAMGVVKAFGSERFEHRRVERLSETRMDLGMQLARLQARFDGAVSVVTAIGTALVVVVGVFRVSSGALSPGDLVVFATYARKLNSPLKDIARESGKTSKALARADEIAELLAADEILEERPGAYRGPRARGAIEVEGVTFSHTEDRSALHEVSLRIEPGSRVALVGPSGAGKSTLAALIARFYDPASGRVLIDGRDLRDCRLAWLRDQIGVLLQDTVLFTGTVAENIAYGTSATEGEIVAAAKAAAAHAFVSELPGGYETQLGPQGVGLSGGQRQRIGIARTLLRNPPVLVLDEPTTGLDAETQTHVLDGLRELMRERTTILITHQTELWETADQVLEIERGRIVRRWSPEGRQAPAEAPTARRAEEPALSRDDRGTRAPAVERPRSGASGWLAVVTSGFPRRSETFLLNELLALDAAGALAGVFATKPGDEDVPQPGAERLADRVRVLAPGTEAEQGRELARRLAGTGVAGVHGYFAHTPAAVAAVAARRARRPVRLQRPRPRRAQGLGCGACGAGERCRLRDRLQRRRRRAGRALGRPARCWCRTASTCERFRPIPPPACRAAAPARRRAAGGEEGVRRPRARRCEGSTARPRCGSSATGRSAPGSRRRSRRPGSGDAWSSRAPLNHDRAARRVRAPPTSSSCPR